jgi:tRNA-2-methylthio-N6-dimethylallyladenosine synthase
MPRHVAEEAKAERLARLQALIDEQQLAFNQAMVGRTVPVLFEKPGRRAGQVIGRSPYLQAVWVEGPDALIGTIAPATIRSAARNSLAGTLAGPARSNPERALSPAGASEAA